MPRSDLDSRNAQVVPTNHLADLLEPHLTWLENTFVPMAQGRYQKNGPFSAIFQEASDTLDISYESASRLLRRIRHRETTHVRAEVADVLLDACNIDPRTTDLPTLAGTDAAAHEMVDVWASDLPELQRVRLARSIRNFSDGYIRASADDSTLALVEAQTARRRERNKQRREALTAQRQEALAA